MGPRVAGDKFMEEIKANLGVQIQKPTLLNTNKINNPPCARLKKREIGS